MAIDLSPFHIVRGDDIELVQKLNDALDATEEGVNQGLSEMDEAVGQAEIFRDQSADSASSTAADVLAAAGSAGESLAYRNEARSARDEAVAIAYGGDYSIAPAAGNVPISRPDGTLDPGWIAGEYSAMLVGHINYAIDLANQGAKAVNGGEVSVAAGSAARPSISLGTNKSTGLFFPAGDEIAFAVNGVEVLRIDATGIVT